MEDKMQETVEKPKCKLSFPMLTTISGIVWTVFGVLNLLVAIFSIIASVQTNSNEMGFWGSLFIFLFVAIPFIFGAVFIYVGMQTIKGKARDVVGNSTGSIVIGVFYLFVSMQKHSITSERFCGTTFFLAGMLIIAGILALIGRKQYKVWQNAQAKQK